MLNEHDINCASVIMLKLQHLESMPGFHLEGGGGGGGGGGRGGSFPPQKKKRRKEKRRERERGR